MKFGFETVLFLVYNSDRFCNCKLTNSLGMPQDSCKRFWGSVWGEGSVTINVYNMGFVVEGAMLITCV